MNVPQLEVLATLEGELCLGLALCAFQSEDNLLGGLGLLVEDWLGLTTVTGLLTVVTTLSLSEEGGLDWGLVFARGNQKWYFEHTFPALYWVTLCWVCFLQSLPLQ